MLNVVLTHCLKLYIKPQINHMKIDCSLVIKIVLNENMSVISSEYIKLFWKGTYLPFYIYTSEMLHPLPQVMQGFQLIWSVMYITLR